jgi:proline iminopeptidase
MLKKYLYFFCLITLLFAACKNKNKPNLFAKTNGEVMLDITANNNSYKVWVKKVGKGNKHLLMLHGGPGCTSEYFENFPKYIDTNIYSIYFYDQLGSYRSSHPNDTTLWNTSRFVNEVYQVQNALGIDKIFLLGHSWGGILGLEYALKYPEKLQGFIMSNMVASIPKYEAYNKILRTQQPKNIIDTLEKYEQLRDFKNKSYVAQIDKIYKKHICRLNTWPSAVERTFAHLNETIYMQMQGPNEFTFEGNLTGWDKWEAMKTLKMPVLTIGADFDTMNPAEMEEMSKMVKNGTFKLCKNSGHMAMWDSPTDYFEGLNSFLNAN